MPPEVTAAADAGNVDEVTKLLAKADALSKTQKKKLLNF